jgi:hypothetical protein
MCRISRFLPAGTQNLQALKRNTPWKGSDFPFIMNFSLVSIVNSSLRMIGTKLALSPKVNNLRNIQRYSEFSCLSLLKSHSNPTGHSRHFTSPTPLLRMFLPRFPSVTYSISYCSRKSMTACWYWT